MSKKERREFSPEFKAKVCIEILKEEKSLSEIAQLYDIHQNLLRTWKREFLENSSEVFKADKKSRKNEEVNVDELYKEMGKLKVEVEWFKKKLTPLGIIYGKK